MVVEVFIAERDPGAVVRSKRDLRIDAVALDVHEFAIAVGVLVDRIEAAGQIRAQGAAEVDGRAPVEERAALQREFLDRPAVGFLEHAVDDAAAAAAPENHRIRALEHFDALDVVEVTEVLDIVADAVDEEVRAGALPAQDDLVAIELALMWNDTGNVADRFAEALKILVLDEIRGEHGHRLRHIDERSLGFRRRRDAGGDVADGGAAAGALFAIARRRVRDRLRRHRRRLNRSPARGSVSSRRRAGSVGADRNAWQHRWWGL